MSAEPRVPHACTCVLFDFDDTLVHLQIDWSAVEADLRRFAAQRGISISPGRNLMAYANGLSRTLRDKRVVDAVLGAHEDACVRSGAYRFFDSMVGALIALETQGVRIGVASGNRTRTIRSVLAAGGVLEHVHAVCGRDKVRWGKPAPDVIRACLLELGAKSTHTLLVGDSGNDCLAAQAAGVGFFRIRTGSRNDAERLRRSLGLGA